MTMLKNETALATSMAAIVTAVEKLDGATATFTLEMARFMADGGTLYVGSGPKARMVYVLDYLEKRFKTNAAGKVVEDGAHKKELWEAFLTGPLCYSEEAAKTLTAGKNAKDKKQNNTMKSKFSAALRPAAYIAQTPNLIVGVKVKDGVLAGVPIAQAIDLFDDTGNASKSAQERVQRLIETEESEGREITPEKAFEKVQKQAVTATGKAGIPTTTDLLARWTKAAIDAGMVPPKDGRENTRADDKADAAIAFLIEGFNALETTDECSFAFTDERETQLLKLADYLNKWIANA
jgi:hypothetical protein